jgi:hypothetical protein
MKIVVCDGKEQTLDVRIRYDRGLSNRGGAIVARTVVVVQDESGRVVGQGVAVQRPGDKPDRVKGRNVALARALAGAGLTKVERTQVWDGLADRGMKGIR